MKKEELRRAYIEEKYLREWLFYGIRKYENGTWKKIISEFKWNDDGSVDVEGSLDIHGENVPLEIPFKFNIVTDNFSCRNTIIKSLNGFPIEIGGNLWLNHNIADGFKVEDIRKVCKIKGSIYHGVVLLSPRLTKEDIRKVCKVHGEIY